MYILVLNSGSSSLKFELFNRESSLIEGLIEEIGSSRCNFQCLGSKKKVKIKNNLMAVKFVLNFLKEQDYNKIDVVGHRVVHGGEEFDKAVMINDKVIEKIKKYSELAPLHNPANLSGILACKKLLPRVKQVAVFDTSFHQTLLKEAYLYAIPLGLYKRYGIRKYGFHGISHKYISIEVKKIFKKNLKIISCHLGNGSSITAIKNGKSIDTSMGFTPLQGLMMGTRSGDIDPEVVAYLTHKLGVSVDKVIRILNERSGLKGISGESDFRLIRERIKKQDHKAELAREMYIYRIVDYIGGYNTLLNGAEVLVFTGGIGEHGSDLREMICDYLKFFGVDLDQDKNKKNEMIISSKKSKIKVLVLKTDEELMIARECLKI